MRLTNEAVNKKIRRATLIFQALNKNLLAHVRNPFYNRVK